MQSHLGHQVPEGEWEAEAKLGKKAVRRAGRESSQVLAVNLACLWT